MATENNRSGEEEKSGSRASSTSKKSDPKKNTGSKRGDKIRLLGAALVVIVSLFAGFIGGMLGAGNGVNVTNPSSGTQKKVVLSESQLISDVAKRVSPSVVSVNVTSKKAPSMQSLFDFFGPQQPTTLRSAGTGIILSSSGYIITNRHVVPEGTTKVSVTLSDGTKLKDVKVVGRTSPKSSLDIAFLKVGNKKGEKLNPAKLGNSAKMKVGDKVIAIGNALGQFQNTVTTGIISGYGRSVQAGSETGHNVETLQDLFQTDAAINHGNSGGPLVNVNGQVIGINTAIAGNAQNIGFAIPINDVKGLVDQVLSTGKFVQPFLGVRYTSITNDIAKHYNLRVDQGAYILPREQAGNSIVPHSPADKAGLKPGDIIIAVNGQKIDSRHSLTSLLDQHKAGDTVKLSVVRGKKHLTLNAKLSTIPSSRQ
jgi:serine protease Do